MAQRGQAARLTESRHLVASFQGRGVRLDGQLHREEELLGCAKDNARAFGLLIAQLLSALRMRPTSGGCFAHTSCCQQPTARAL